MDSNKYIRLQKENEKKLSKQKKANKHINLGIIAYFLILTYLIFCVLSFTLSEKTNYTIAEMGTIVKSETFNGMIIKNETVINSEIKGTTNFFVHEGQKINKNSYVCLVDAQGELIDLLNQNVNQLTNNDSRLQEQIRTFVLNKNDTSFTYTYDALDKINKGIFDLSNTIIYNDKSTLNNILNTYTNEHIDRVKLYQTPISGLVSYHIDGYESINRDNFTYEDLYQKTNKQDSLNEENTGLFKMVEDYKWYLAAEINGICQKYIEDKNSVNVIFVSKGLEINAKVDDIINEGDKTYVIFEFDRFLNQFIYDRFIDFKIVYNSDDGIKIPNSAVTSKEFVQIPIEALEIMGQSFGVQKKVTGDDYVGGESVIFTKVNLYYSDGITAYIPISKDISIGNIIMFNDNGKRREYQLKTTKLLDGVYVINKGYADFRLIETVTFNEDYRIVKTDTSFGIIMYDRIAADSYNITDKSLVN